MVFYTYYQLFNILFDRFLIRYFLRILKGIINHIFATRVAVKVSVMYDVSFFSNISENFQLLNRGHMPPELMITTAQVYDMQIVTEGNTSFTKETKDTKGLRYYSFNF